MSYNLLEMPSEEIKKGLIEGKITIAVIGLGYIGLPFSCYLASKGVRVIGVDINPTVVKMVNSGTPQIYEPGLKELLNDAIGNERFYATTDVNDAVRRSEVIMITVGTPVGKNGINFSYVEQACKNIANSMKRGSMIILRSTVAPLTTEKTVCKLLESDSGLIAGKDFGLAFCPERTVEGNAFKELGRLPNIIGGLDEKSTSIAAAIFEVLTPKIVKVRSPRIAEMAKIFDNVYRDTNIALANELAVICEKLDIDVIETIKACNASYDRTNMLIPGAGVGGSCLNKDPYILSYSVREKGFEPSLILSARERNISMPRHVVDLVKTAFDEMKKELNGSKITILGFAFKSNTDDTRETVAVPIIAALKEQGANIVVFDPYVPQEKIESQVGNINTTKVLIEAIENSDCIVVLADHHEFRQLNLPEIKKLLTTPAAIIDGRHVFDPKDVIKEKLIFKGVGRPETYFKELFEI
ncbi:MAG: nucleotide sugar dehydrogenase [Promethearchaeota archaeon]